MTLVEADRGKWMGRPGIGMAHYVDSVVSNTIITSCGRRMRYTLGSEQQLVEAGMATKQCRTCVRLTSAKGF